MGVRDSPIRASEVGDRSKHGFVLLALRSLAIHLLQAASVLLLARWLTPEDYGTYGVLYGWIAVSWYLCDLGTAGALVQQGDNPTRRQLQASAALQLLLATGLTALFWIFAEPITARHSMGSSGAWMLRVIALTIPIYAARGAPRILMDRGLKFKSTAWIELAETAALYATQILAAGLGFGAWSFIFGNAVRSVLGTALFLIAASRSGQLHLPVLRWKELAPLMKFGIPFQLNALVPALRALTIPLVLGSLLPLGDVGMVTWCAGIAAFPMILANNYNQVVFPSLSLLGKEPEAFARIANRGTQLGFLGMAYLFGLAAACSEPLIELLFPQRWSGATELLPLALLAVGLFAFRYLLAAVLNASGMPGKRLGIETVSLVIEFVVTAGAVASAGMQGYFWAGSGIQIVTLAVTIVALRGTLNLATLWRGISAGAGAMMSYVLVTTPTVLSTLPALPRIVAQFALFHLCFFALLRLMDATSWKDLLWVAREVLSRRPGRSAGSVAKPEAKPEPKVGASA